MIEFELRFSDGREVELSFPSEAEAYQYAFDFAEIMGFSVTSIRSVA